MSIPGPGERVRDAGADLLVLIIFIMGAVGSNALSYWYEPRWGKLTFLQHIPLWATEFATAAGTVAYGGQIVWYRILKPLVAPIQARRAARKRDKGSNSGGSSGEHPPPGSSEPGPQLNYFSVVEWPRGSVLTLPTVSVWVRLRRSLLIALFVGCLAAIFPLGLFFAEYIQRPESEFASLITFLLVLLALVVPGYVWLRNRRTPTRNESPGRRTPSRLISSARRGSSAGLKLSGRWRSQPRSGSVVLAPQAARVAFSRDTARRLWLVTMLDIVVVALMVAAGNWFDRTSPLTSLITLGGHHTLLLTIALVGFAILAGMAVLTDGFTSANRLELSLTITGSMVSVAALAATLWPLLLLAVAALLLVFLIHPMRGH